MLAAVLGLAPFVALAQDFEDPLAPRTFEAEPLAVPSIPNNALRRVAADRFPEFADDMPLESLRRAASWNGAYLAHFSDSQPLYFGDRVASVGELKRTMAALLELLRAGRSELNARLRSDFELYESAGSVGDGGVVFTGYFEPEIPAVPAPDPAHPVPVYARPADLVAVAPSEGFPYDYARRTRSGGLEVFSSRARIDRGALKGQGLELFWAEDPTDLFFLQLQGSGFLRLPSGERVRVGFDGANGHPYRSIARYLIDRGEIIGGADSLSIMRYVRAQSPARKLEILEVDPRYSFFQKREGDGPLGSIGVPLTPGRSLAVSRQLPRGCLAFFLTRRPVADRFGRIIGFAPVRRFALSQDAGAAIDNPGRADVFWGAGDQAAAEASHMKEGGRLYFLLLKSR
ncbi:MAG: MltA domain-containing protein [Elusimicrobia bacterium]|nr:MltA domain-containing protein [Elusimicrobiota bacterium]